MESATKGSLSPLPTIGSRQQSLKAICCLTTTLRQEPKEPREKALAKEARLTAFRVRLQAVKAELAAYGVAIHGAVPSAVAGSPSVNVDDEDAADKKAHRLLKRKIPSPKDGWKNGKGATIVAFSDKNRLLQHLFDIF